MRKRIWTTLCMLTMITQFVFSQFVSIIDKKFVLNGNASCPVYFNGANTPWDKWNDFGGSYNAAFWSSHFATLKNNGINSTRIWFSCDGSGQPTINSSGVTTGVSSAFWTNCDHLFEQARANGIYVMATMMSFDHTKPSNVNGTNWQNMLNSEANVQTFVDVYIVPFVNRYKNNPYLFSIDACNEIEWIAENGNAGGTDKNWGCSYAILQRYVARLAAGVHGAPRADGSTVLVTVGSAATKWNGTMMRNGANGTGWVANPDGNKWSDAALKAQYNNAAAVLDYYSPHYYGWIDQYYHNPYQKSPADFGIDDKACLVGETPSGDLGTPSMTVLNSYNALKALGWQGHYPWTSNGVDNFGDISKFGAAALSFKNANSGLVIPPCSVPPQCQAAKLGNDLSLCGVTGGVTLNSQITLTTNKTFTWYRGATQVPGSTPTMAGVTTAGTYVVVADSATGKCVSRDTIIVSSTIPTPVLASAHICDPATTSLSTSVSGSGLSYQWYEGTSPIEGANTATLSGIRSTGTYKVEISAAGCTTQSASAAVTSSLPTPIDGCMNAAGKVTLGISNAAGTNFGWFAAATGGTSLGTGTSFETPSITSTTTYYVQDMNAISVKLGKTEQTGTPIWDISDYETLDKKQKLNILSAVTLSSAKVYVSTAGTSVVIRVRNAADDATIGTKSFPNLGAGIQTLTGIDIYLPAGTYLLDAMGTSSTLQYEGWDNNTNTYAYPYTAPNVAELVNTESWSNKGYGPFYDITLSSGTNCGRLAVIAKIDASCGSSNLLPSVSVTSPAADTIVSYGTSITLEATASDTDGTIEKVDFYDGTKLLGSGTSSPFSFTWQGASTGTHYITAVATDNAGGTSTSSSIEITITQASAQIKLKKGWNLVGCPLKTNTDVDKAMSSIWSDVETVKDLDSFWDASVPAAINSLTQVGWGKGYMVKVKSACTLDWIVR